MPLTNRLAPVLGTALIITLSWVLVFILWGDTMARGHEDWNVKTGSSSIAAVDPMEAIMRTGTPGPWLRTGRIVYVDGFEGSLAPWSFAESGSGGSATLDETYAFRGRQSLKLIPSTPVDGWGSLAKTLPYVISGNVGFEVMLAGDVAADRAYIEIVYRTGGTYYRYRTRIDLTSGVVAIEDENKAWQTVISGLGDLSVGPTFYYFAKMVINPVNIRYERVYFNNLAVNVSEYTIFSEPQPGPDYINIYLRVSDTSGDQGPVYFDDVVITIDEP